MCFYFLNLTSNTSETCDVQLSLSLSWINTLCFNYCFQVQESLEVVESFGDVLYDEGKLSKFLTRVTPSLIGELDKVQRSKAFSQNFNYDEDIPSKPVKILYTLRSKHHLPLEDVRTIWNIINQLIYYL